MVKVHDEGFFYIDNEFLKEKEGIEKGCDKNKGRTLTMSYNILKSHNSSDNIQKLKIKFDKAASHDITYVAITQTARASGLTSFPIPYILTNCHNSLCAVGGTINEDDHIFGLSAAKKYGGIFVPAHLAVIHQYVREEAAFGGGMILGSDSHTRYGALGTMGVGEGGPELVKQLLGKTYDIDYPEIVAVYLEGESVNGVGPQDVAVAIIKEVFEKGTVKNKIMEFIGPGIKKLSVDFRNGIDVMTTETTCLSSIWETDDAVKEYYRIHGRSGDYKKLEVPAGAFYDSLIKVDLSKVRPMIAIPYHPSNAYSIDEFNANKEDILNKIEEDSIEQTGISYKPDFKSKIKGKDFYVDQAVIAGCSGGTYENINIAARILKDRFTGDGKFSLSVYPASQPINIALVNDGSVISLMNSGVSLRSAFCGPCFGADNVPGNNGFSIRHTTRNFPSREGSKPSSGQIAAVALMDTRSIAATALNKGILTGADKLDVDMKEVPAYIYDNKSYKGRIYSGYKKPEADANLVFGPNITDWPFMSALSNDLLLVVASVISDPVTTTDELIPSGETSSYRSNPLKLAEFALSRRDPSYVKTAKTINEIENNRKTSGDDIIKDLYACGFSDINLIKDKVNFTNTNIGSVVCARKPGDGSAREQAASSQKVLGGCANIAAEYATKRYRSNLINWGMIPFTVEDFDRADFKRGDIIFIPGIKEAIKHKNIKIPALHFSESSMKELTLSVGSLSEEEIDIIVSGSLINYYSV